MFYKILDLLIREDTFKLFSSQSPCINDIAKYTPKPKTLREFKQLIIAFFTKIIRIAPPDSLYSNEALRMIKFTETLFVEVYKLGNEQNLHDPIDTVVDLYVNSLSKFVEDLDIPILHDQFHYIIS